MENKIPLTYRQIEPELYRDHYKWGIRLKDLRTVIGVGLIILGFTMLAPLWLGIPILLVIPLPFLWLGTSIPFLRWARNNRRPNYLEHLVKGKIAGCVQHRVDPRAAKYNIPYLLD